MKRIETVNREIDKFGPGKDGFRSAQPGVSEPTYLSAEWCNGIQESLARTIEAAGMVPGASLDQFTAALQQLFGVFMPDGDPAIVRNIGDKLTDFANVRDQGALGNGVNDDIEAVLRARSKSRFIHFPRRANKDTTYYLGWFSSDALRGATISTDRGVVLSFASNQYSLFKDLVFDSDIEVFFRDIGVRYYFPKTPSEFKKDSMPMVTPGTACIRTALNCSDDRQVSARSLGWPTGDVFTDEPVTRTGDTLAFAARASESFRGAFVDLGPYETVSAFFDNGVSRGSIGIILRGRGGYSTIYTAGGAGNYFTAQKVIGAPMTGNNATLSWSTLGQGIYQSYHAENSVWSVTRISRSRVIVKLNGKALTSPYLDAVGDVVEIGFVTFGKQAFSVSGLTVERRTDAIIGAQQLEELRVFGDSTAETFPGSWDQYLRQQIDGVAGLRLGQVRNFAVAGTTLEQAYASMQTNGFGSAYYVIVCAGTNNGQGQSELTGFKALVATVVDYILASGRRPVIVIPGMWYTQAQAGGKGQASGNYDKAAPYRMVLERIGFEKKCVVVKINEELPNPDPRYLTSSPATALLRDNIHQDVLGYQLYARAIAQAIVNDYCTMSGSVEALAAPDKFLNGATSIGDVRYVSEKNGMGCLLGTVGVTSDAGDTEVLEMPRWCCPTYDTNFDAQAFSANGATSLGVCYLYFNSATRRLAIRFAPAGTRVLILGSLTFKTL